MDKLLIIEPQELCFPLKLKEQVSCLVRLYNNTLNHVAFKVMTTCPKNYCVKPNVGIILPGSSCNVTVIMYALNEAPPNMECKDKFLIRSALASPVATIEYVHQLLNSEDGDVVQKCKLGVIYTSPPVDITSTSVRKLLDVQPSELQFPFELKKQLKCSLQLSNMTENHVAFKVKTTDPKKYCVQPNIGIVLPRSTCDVIVVMQAQTKILRDRQCKDKFLIQSVVTSTAATIETLTSEMFETGCNVEEFKLKVVYTLPPHQQSSNNRTSEADSSREALTLRDELVQEIDRNETSVGDLVVKGIIIGLLGLISWFLIKKMLPPIWSMTFVIMMLVVKTIKSIISESVEDWIVRSLVLIFWKFASILSGRSWNITSSS